MKTSIIVPCYNEETNIEPLVARFDEFANQYDMELLLVDNGSNDNTGIKIDMQVKAHTYIRKVAVEQNQGYGYGILCGLEEAYGDCLGWIHADLQSDPMVFTKMIESAIKETENFLYKGARKNRSIDDRFFTRGMAIFESLLFGIKLEDINSQPTLLSRGFYERWENPTYDFSLDLYVYALAVMKEIPVLRFDSIQSKRLHGVSTWNDGWKSRVGMVKRVMDYSVNVKNLVQNEEW